MDIVKNLSENEKIRNICILAHVDHGKTTLVDNLISSNKIISDKNIGKIKYLDNREDEQTRQITMKSSSILLTHVYNKHYLNEVFNDTNYMKNEHNLNYENDINNDNNINNEKKRNNENKSSDKDKPSNENNTYLINIIDTPGHVDFSSEVSTCIRICDGSLILIDCIEGICSQTKIVLRQTWKEMIKSILVINKIDKLITNKNMDSISAYEHINNIIEQVNAYIYQLYVEGNMNNDSIETSDLEKYSYSPIKGNVLLCSSIHCWCVDLNIFSFLFCRKMNINLNNVDKIKKYMWNQYYFNMKEKKILKIPNDNTTYSSINNSTKKKKKNLFTLVVLDFLWKIYDITIINRDDEKIKNVCLELNISDSFLKKNKQNNFENNTFILTFILSTLLNLSRSVFYACVEVFPSPKNIDEQRLFKIFPSLYNKEIYSGIINCSFNNFTVIYISKYICANVQNNTLVGFKGFYDKNTFIAICKIYSGILHENMILYICGNNIKTVVKKIYVCMGGDLLPISKAYAGNIVAVYLSLSKEEYKNSEKNQEKNTLLEETLINDNINKKVEYYNGCINQNEKKEDTFENADKNFDKYFLNKSENMIKINNQLKNMDEHFINNIGSIDGEDLQYLSNTLMNLIKNKRNKKEHNIFLMNNECIFLNKNVTLSNQKNVDSFILPFTDTCSTILHTIVEPKNIQDMNKFLYGLILLYTCDTSIDIDFNDRGEYILKFCGEIHMQKCLSDFVNIYSNIEIKTSDANISIREGINDNYIKIKRKKNKIHENLKNLYNFYLKVQMESRSNYSENHTSNDIIAKENHRTITNDNKNNTSKEKINLYKENNNDSLKMENSSSDNFFKNINLEKDNHFLNILFNYSHNTICNKLNNNSFFIFLSVLNIPDKILHFFDKHYSNIQTILENRCISPYFLNYNKTNFSNKSEDFLYKQCLINLEKCINDLFFSDNTNYDKLEECNMNEPIISDSEKREEKENVEKGNDNEKINFLKKNKNYHLQLWDICVQNGSITLLYIKKYYNKKKNNNEYILDNILTNEKYKNIINQRNFVDTYLSDTNNDINIYLNNICLGFKLASKYGPIAQEPIRGALFIIEGLIIDESFNEEVFEDANTKEENLEEKINSGNIIALMKETCLFSLQQNKLRIFEPMLRLKLTCESSVLGKVYNVLLKRRCSILSEEIKDGYFLYCIDAHLPLFNSFKLAEELRSKCSGNVIYDIQFSHWNKLNEDIFLSNEGSAIIYDEDFDVKLTDNTATEIVNYIRRAKVK